MTSGSSSSVVQHIVGCKLERIHDKNRHKHRNKQADADIHPFLKLPSNNSSLTLLLGITFMKLKSSKTIQVHISEKWSLEQL